MRRNRSGIQLLARVAISRFCCSGFVILNPAQHLRGRAPEPVDGPGVHDRLRLLAHAADLDILQAESESFVDALAPAG